MKNETIRVLVADDHRLTCEGIRLVLERDGIEVVGIAATGRQAVDMTLELEPDVVLLDIRMPDMDGLQALAAIKAALSQTSVIMLTSYANPEYMARAISLGAAGYLTKDQDPTNVPRAVRTVIAGDAIISLDLLYHTLEALSDITNSTPIGPYQDRPSLTPQELRILSLIAEGLDNAAIAEILSVSKNTVKTHTRNIFMKIGVSDRTQAAVWAIRSGLAT
jgi:DNA-binding NarL/FixJ family response regulator